MENGTKKQETLALVCAMAEIAFDHGKAEGLELGKRLGFVAGVTSLKGALSCGLRHGSPECGKALESLKRLGLDE